MLNIKKTDFEKGRASFAVRMAGGGLALPDDKPGLSSMMSIFAAQSATAKNSLEDLKIITAGRNVTPGAMVDDDAFLSTGSTTAADLPLQMKLSAAYLTDPGFRPEADSLWASIVPVIDKQLTATPGAVAQSKLPTLLANNDMRFGLPPVAELTKRSFAEAKAVVTPLLGTAAIEIAVVGDVDEAAVIKAVAESFGALPTRAAAAPSYEAERKASFRVERTPIVLTHSGGADQALVGAAWPTDDDSDYRRTLALNLLKEIIDLELTDEVREKLGASYGVDVSSTMSDTYRDFGYLMVSSVVAPDKGDEVDQAIASVVASLRDKPVSADLLDRARQPMLENVVQVASPEQLLAGLSRRGAERARAARPDPPARGDHPLADRCRHPGAGQAVSGAGPAAAVPHPQRQGGRGKGGVALVQLLRGGGSPIGAAPLALERPETR